VAGLMEWVDSYRQIALDAIEQLASRKTCWKT
jgi:hypothetical protein